MSTEQKRVDVPLGGISFAMDEVAILVCVPRDDGRVGMMQILITDRADLSDCGTALGDQIVQTIAKLRADP